MRFHTSSYRRNSSPDRPVWARRAEPVAGRPDRLVRLLGALHLAGVDARRVRHVVRAVQFAGLRPGRGDRGLRQRDRVGPHIRDVAVLVQPLRHRHRVLGRVAELARGLLLQRGGAERGVRGTAVGLALHARHRERRVAKAVGERGRRLAVQVQHVLGLQLADGAEVATLRHPAAVDRHQRGRERGHVGRVPCFGPDLREHRFEVPVPGGAERDPLPLAVHHEPDRHRLDPAGGQLRHDLLPQHRRDLVAVEPVEHPPGLVGLHQALVHFPRVRHGLGDRLGRDLVEDHAPGGHLRLELFEQVPGDRLALAVFISGEQQFVGVLEQVLELGDLLPLVGVDDVERLEVGVDVHAEARPWLPAVLRRYLRSLVRHVADVADARLDHVVLAEVARDRACLGRRLDDDETPAMGGFAVSAGAAAGCAVLARSATALRAAGGRTCPCCHSLTFTSRGPFGYHGRPGGYRSRPAGGRMYGHLLPAVSMLQLAAWTLVFPQPVRCVSSSRLNHRRDGAQ